MVEQHYSVISCYKYINIKNPDDLKNQQISLCNTLNLKGRIIIAKEGINATLSGKIKNIETYKKELLKNIYFSDITFKENKAANHPFQKLSIKVKDEIVSFSKKVDLSKAGKKIAPSQLKNLIDNNEDIIILDTRNNYEVKIGKFRNALNLNIDDFRDFSKNLHKISHLKNKKIITYCTGGVRCEKASAYLVENGFKEVFQLEGGILNYNAQHPNTYFEGKCFVFDNRISTPINLGSNSTIIASCEICNKPCDNYINCSNINCDKLFICCPACTRNLNASCSLSCALAKDKRTK
ncbi:MAG: rhodanese-related sulfurtransferase [Nanoarchaeota archaeon]